MSNNKAGNNESICRRRGSLAPMPLNSIYPRTIYPPFPDPTIAAAAATHNHRRMSTSSLGLCGLSPSRTSSFSYDRRSSTSSTCSTAAEDDAIDEDDGIRSTPNAQYSRRMSLGAQAIRSFRGASIPGIIG